MSRCAFVWTAALFCVLSGSSQLVADEPVWLADEPNVDAETWLVSQPGDGSAAAETPRSATPRSSARGSSGRLSRAPNMFGDSFGNTGQLAIRRLVPDANGILRDVTDATDVPFAGGRGFKVAENNKPLPADRVYFVYNGVQNGLTSGLGVPRDGNVDRYTFGFEKATLDGLWSVNVALPFTNSFAFTGESFTLNGGNLGNLNLALKRLAYSNESLAVSAGLGFGLPTGSDLSGRIGDQNLFIQNQAVHLVPYVGFLATPSDSWFFQGFLDVDFAANGNRVDVGAPGGSVGKLTQQNLFHADLTVGRWFYQNADADYLTGIAAIGELHYTSTIQDADTFAFAVNQIGLPPANGMFFNPANRTDVLNLTAGLQFQIGNLSNLRVACVVPVRNQPNRQFDSEIQVSFNRFF